ncbi:MAG: metal-sensitive transcriptional regulator [Actinomycetaceae bacterium]|nr:metal-sensitive transcriptional regulator [Actinomycetaceae bacterium]
MAEKKTPATCGDLYDERHRRVLNRLKRARGQLDAVIRAFESGEDCRDVTTQLAAVSKALDKASYAMIYMIMNDCVDVERGEEIDRFVPKDEEIEKLFLMFS